MLFGAALWTLWRTNRAAYRRHREQLAADRNDRFRQEVADLLGERYATVDAAYRLADASAQHDDAVANGAPPADRVAKFLAVREKHTPQLNTVEHLAIRAALLTNNTELIAKLDQIRTASQGWKDLVDKDPVEVFIKMRDDLDTAFAELETLTRQLVTSDGVG
ncbi:hypothetical protein A5692_03565 [Mycobacterium sp. E342]|nr:hypothetical protein A5692_03565 [Mycobacterium sp. E342]